MSLTGRDLLLMLAVIAGLILAMALVKGLARTFDLSAEVQRKLVHIATGLVALSFPLVFDNALPVLVLVAAAILVMMALRLPVIDRSGLGSVLHSVKRTSYGEIYLALAVGFLFFRSGGAPILYGLPLLVITLSDTASALIGTAYGRRRFPVEDGTKSLEGVIAFFMVTWLTAMIALVLFSAAGRVEVVLLSLLIALFCALVEADSWKGLDNLFVPIGAHLFLVRYLWATPAELVTVAVVFVVVLAVVLAVATLCGFTRHAARAYTVLLFLVLSVTALNNAVLPMLAIAGHIAATALRPGDSRHPDLDLTAAIAATALGWLFAGEMLGIGVINLYNLTFLAVASGYAGLAAVGRWRWLTVPFLAIAIVVYIWAVTANGPAFLWIAPLSPLLAPAMALPVLPALMMPAWFDRHRSTKIFVLSLLVPIALYLILGVLR